MRIAIVKKLLLTLTILSLSCCTIATSFKVIDDNGNQDPNREVVVAITHVILGDDEELNDRFWDYVFRIEEYL